MKPYVVGAIFARGGSKGVPQKNSKLLCGKPLIAYSIEVGLALKGIDRLIVSTDDPQISQIAREYGAEVPFIRPRELAQDQSPEILSWKHAIQTLSQKDNRAIDILVSIPTTSPLRDVCDVEACLQKLLDTDADIVITVRKAQRSPYFNMVVLDAGSNARLVIPPTQTIMQRQQTPGVYDITTVCYAARASYVLKASSVLEGKVKAVVVPEERALDIDTLFDWEIAQLLMTKEKATR